MSRFHLLLLTLLVMGCRAQIHHGLDERQANEIQSALEQRGVKAQKVLEANKKPTWAIEVEDSRASEALRILTELGLPRPRTEGFGDVFGKGSLVPTPTEERALYLEALSGEIARTLEAVEGVTSARVHLVLAPLRAGTPVVPAKAAAFLRVKPGGRPHVEQLKVELKALIASSVEGLSPDAVTLVVDEPPRAAVNLPEAGSELPLRMLSIALGLAISFLAIGMVLLVARTRQHKLGASKTSNRSGAPALAAVQIQKAA